MKVICMERFFDKKTYYEDVMYDLADEEVSRFIANGQARRLMLPDGKLLSDTVVKKAVDSPEIAELKKEKDSLIVTNQELKKGVAAFGKDLKKESDPEKKKKIAEAINKANEEIKEINKAIGEIDDKIRALK